MEVFWFITGLYAGPGCVLAWRNLAGGIRNGAGGAWLPALALVSVLLGILWLPVWALDHEVFQRAMRG